MTLEKTEKADAGSLAPVSGGAPRILVVSDGGLGLTGSAFPLGDGVFRVGREPGSQIVIDHPQVSRLHAFVAAEAGRYWVGDHGSANGVFLNDQRVVQKAPLAPGDLIRIGPAVLQYVEPVPPPAEEHLPFPIAFALRQAAGAENSERKVRFACLAIEQCAIFLVAAQLGALARHGDDGPLEAVAQVFAKHRIGDQALGMGSWLRLAIDLATTASQQADNPVGQTASWLIHPSSGPLRHRLLAAVTLRNQLSHRWFGAADAYEAEALATLETLQRFVLTFSPLRAVTMVSRVPGSPVPPHGQETLLYVQRGPSPIFVSEGRKLVEPMPEGWCHLLDAYGNAISLAPLYALRTSPASKRPEVFVGRSLSLNPGARVELDSLSSPAHLKEALPEARWLARVRALAGPPSG